MKKSTGSNYREDAVFDSLGRWYDVLADGRASVKLDVEVKNRRGRRQGQILLADARRLGSTLTAALARSTTRHVT